MLKKVAKWFLTFLSTFLPFYLSTCLSAVQLTVETGAAGANVSAVNFGTTADSIPIVSTGTADSLGKAVVTILPDTNYTVFATKHGKGPTVRDQVMMQKAVPVRISADTKISLLLSEVVDKVGVIKIGVVNIPVGKVFMGDIRNVITGEPVAFLQDFATNYDDGISPNNTGYINVVNISAAQAGTYNINIFSPTDKKALNKVLTLPVEVDPSGLLKPTTIYFNFGIQEAMAVQTQDTGIMPEGNVAFEGVVVDTDNKGIADFNVGLQEICATVNQQQIRFQTQTDSNGRFTFYNVPIGKYYEIRVSGLGYEGVWDGPQGGDKGYGYKYEGTKIIVPSDPYKTGSLNIYGNINKTYKLNKVNGRLKGVVKVGGVPLPFAEVQVWGDWDKWAGTDAFSQPNSNTGSPTNAHTRTDATGHFDIVGLSTGNITISVQSDLIGTTFIYNYNGDWNSRNVSTDTVDIGFRNGDDIRVAISYERSVAGEPYWIEYSTGGAALPTNSEGVVVNISTGGVSNPCYISGTIKFLETTIISNTSSVVISAREQLQENADWSTYKPKSRFTVIPNGIYSKGSIYSYTIPVSSNTLYWVDVNSEYLGIVNKFDTRADFTGINTGEKILDFALAPAGKIRGVVRLPDGSIFKPNFNKDASERRIEVRANSRISGGGTGIPDSGVFEITGLIPGLYSISIYGDGSGYTWPKTITINDVMVSPGKETYIEVPLTNGVKCEANAPSPMPAMPSGTTGYYYICCFPADEILTGHKVDALLDGGSDAQMGFEYNASTYTSKGCPPGETRPLTLGWQPTVVSPGRYKFYLIKYEMFGTEGETGDDIIRSKHQTITGISQAKNIEIKYDPLQPNVTTYIPFEGAVTGKGIITGKITGDNVWIPADYEKGKKEGQSALMKNIPTVMLYDVNGVWRGFSGARPNNDTESIIPWMTFFMEPNEITEHNAITKSPVYYYIDMLPPGKYTMLAETPNYPPFVKDIVIYSTATTTLDLDFDVLSGSGLSVSGVVTSTDGVKLEGAEVVVKHKSVEKHTVTNSSGNYSLVGLPKGVYRIIVSKSGYAIAGDKIGLGESLTAKNFQLVKGDSAIAGTVYSQKMPFAKTLANAKIACYDETYNTTNLKKYLPVNKAKTDKNGYYYISGLTSEHIYKVYVMAPGKIVEYVEVTSTAAYNTQDFELKSLPPKLKIMVKKTENPRKYLFMFESPKKLVAPPECWYNAGDRYDENKAIQALPLSGPNNTYSLYVNLLESNISQNYNLRVISDDGSGKKNIEDIKFGGNVKRQVKKDVAEGIAEGDNVAIDELGDDNTQIEVDAGCLTAASAVAAPASYGIVGAPSFAIGGFSTNIPSFKLQAVDSSIASQLVSVDAASVAGDVYQVDLSNAQMNKSLTISLNYDKEKVSEADIDKLKVYQYNSDDRVWDLVPGNKTIDPLSGTVSVDVESITDAASSTSTARLAGRSVIENGRFVVSRAASTSQSGVFAVFKSQPSTEKQWTGDFQIFNFPNPFNLKDKIVTLTDGGALGTNLSTKGTVLKYCLPADKSGTVKIFIYNIAGELVREIDDGERNGGFIYYADWDGRNDRDDECASGVYFVIVKVENKTLNKGKPMKMAIVK